MSTTKINLELIAKSTVWNFHGINLTSVAMKKGSNLNKELRKIKESGYDGLVTLWVNSIGRSQHSESSVEIYKGVTCSEDFDKYYTARHAEILISKNI